MIASLAWRRVAIATALAASVLVWSPGASGQDIPPCAPDRTLKVSATTEVKEGGGAVATEEANVMAVIGGDTAGEHLTFPEGVRVVTARKLVAHFIAPSAPTLEITVSWLQLKDPANSEGEAGQPGISCAASGDVTLPILAARPSHAVKPRNFKASLKNGRTDVAILPALEHPNLSPLEVSMWTSARARYPSVAGKPRTMVVPMRVADQEKYAFELPNIAYASVKTVCRYFSVTCGAVFSEVNSLEIDAEALNRGIVRAEVNGQRSMLARTQPNLEAARYGILVEARPGAVRVRKPRPFGYDVQVRQSGRLVARVRAAGVCTVTGCHVPRHSAELH